jgi:uncharacterized protein (DUF924 family)
MPAFSPADTPPAHRSVARNPASPTGSGVETPQSILGFWFGTEVDKLNTLRRQSALWWRKRAAVDDAIRLRFESWTARAAAGELDAWRDSPPGRLALILLCDQFPRNMYRSTPRAFACDRLARAWCVEGLELGMDASLRAAERVFFYLPLEHSESLADQERSVTLFRDLAERVAPALKPRFDGFLDFAVRHRDVIARFGRFPHRNRILERDSTPAEVAFLQQRGSSF